MVIGHPMLPPFFKRCGKHFWGVNEADIITSNSTYIIFQGLFVITSNRPVELSFSHFTLCQLFPVLARSFSNTTA